MTMRTSTGGLLAGREAAAHSDSTEISFNEGRIDPSLKSIAVVGIWHKAIDDQIRSALLAGVSSRQLEICYVSTVPSRASTQAEIWRPALIEWTVGLTLLRNLALEFSNVSVEYRQIPWEDRTARILVKTEHSSQALIFIPRYAGAPTLSLATSPGTPLYADITADVEEGTRRSQPFTLRVVLCEPQEIRFSTKPDVPNTFLDSLRVRCLEPSAGFPAPPPEEVGIEPISIVALRLTHKGRAALLLKKRLPETDTNDLNLYSLLSARIYDTDLAADLGVSPESHRDADAALDKILTNAAELRKDHSHIRIGAMRSAALRELLFRTGVFFPPDRVSHVGNASLPRDTTRPSGRVLVYAVFVVDLIRTKLLDEYDQIVQWDPDGYSILYMDDYKAGTHTLAMNRLLTHGHDWLVDHITI